VKNVQTEEPPNKKIIQRAKKLSSPHPLWLRVVAKGGERIGQDKKKKSNGREAVRAHKKKNQCGRAWKRSAHAAKERNPRGKKVDLVIDSENHHPGHKGKGRHWHLSDGREGVPQGGKIYWVDQKKTRRTIAS